MTLRTCARLQGGTCLSAQREAKSLMRDSLRVELQKWLPRGSLSRHRVEEMDLAVLETDCEDMPAVSRRVSAVCTGGGRPRGTYLLSRLKAEATEVAASAKFSVVRHCQSPVDQIFTYRSGPSTLFKFVMVRASARSHRLVSRRGREESRVPAPARIPNDACM